MWHRSAVSVLSLTVLVIASGCSFIAAEPVSSSAATLEWRTCTEADVTPRLPEELGPIQPVPVPEGMECAELSVPADYGDSDGRQIALAVARLPYTGRDEPLGSVIYHTGGPSGVGIPEVAMAPERADGLRERFDLVTFNPRGSVAGAQDLFPFEECALSGPRFPTPLTEEEFNTAVADNQTLIEECRETDPEVFDNLDSNSRARDVDALRTALGEEYTNFFGLSYGGVTGASYARLFPDRVRTMFLDSAVSHVLSFEEHERDLLGRAEADFTAFTEWCAQNMDCVWHDVEVPAAWQKLVAEADETPIPMSDYDDASLSGHDLMFAAAPLVGSESTWPLLSDAVEQALDGDASLFLSPSLGRPAYIGAVAAATQCADGVRFEGFESYREALDKGLNLSPNFSSTRATYDAMCTAWPTPEANPHGPIDSDGLPPILTASSSSEFTNASSLAAEVPGSVALEVEGRDHGLFFALGNTCVMEHAERYLVDGSLPEPGTMCALD